MNDVLFERLLYEEESTTLDFKRDQYPFAKATDDQRSEILKDILGFVNAWRRSESYILIGVEDVRGGRSNVVGVSVHLDDHSLQQFVNNLTNRPIRFHYEAFSSEGKQVGVMRIEEQPRPVYLKRDLGKLRSKEVYVRRGSSTDPTKPATPEEIAQMGIGSRSQSAELVVEFAEIDGDDSLGPQISWVAEYCEMPSSKSIPDWKQESEIAGGFASLSFTHRSNGDYYRQLASYEAAKRLVRPARILVRNAGEVAANSVRAEVVVPTNAGVIVCEASELPEAPRRSFNLLAGASALKTFQPAGRRSPGEVSIDRNDQRLRIAMEFGGLQPGRGVRSDVLWIGIFASGEVRLAGLLFADNLPQPKEFTLSITATISQTTMTAAQLTALPDPADPND